MSENETDKSTKQTTYPAFDLESLFDGYKHVESAGRHEILRKDPTLTDHFLPHFKRECIDETLLSEFSYVFYDDTETWVDVFIRISRDCRFWPREVHNTFYLTTHRCLLTRYVKTSDEQYRSMQTSEHIENLRKIEIRSETLPRMFIKFMTNPYLKWLYVLVTSLPLLTDVVMFIVVMSLAIAKAHTLGVVISFCLLSAIFKVIDLILSVVFLKMHTLPLRLPFLFLIFKGIGLAFTVLSFSLSFVAFASQEAAGYTCSILMSFALFFTVFSYAAIPKSSHRFPAIVQLHFADTTGKSTLNEIRLSQAEQNTNDLMFNVVIGFLIGWIPGAISGLFRHFWFSSKQHNLSFLHDNNSRIQTFFLSVTEAEELKNQLNLLKSNDVNYYGI